MHKKEGTEKRWVVRVKNERDDEKQASAKRAKKKRRRVQTNERKASDRKLSVTKPNARESERTKNEREQNENERASFLLRIVVVLKLRIHACALLSGRSNNPE